MESWKKELYKKAHDVVINKKISTPKGFLEVFTEKFDELINPIRNIDTTLAQRISDDYFKINNTAIDAVIIENSTLRFINHNGDEKPYLYEISFSEKGPKLSDWKVDLNRKTMVEEDIDKLIKELFKNSFE